MELLIKPNGGLNDNPKTSNVWEAIGQSNNSNTQDESDNNSSPEWNKSKIYNGGDKVSYQNKVYTAKWWTRGDNPETSNVWSATESYDSQNTNDDNNYNQDNTNNNDQNINIKISAMGLDDKPQDITFTSLEDPAISKSFTLNNTSNQITLHPGRYTISHTTINSSKRLYQDGEIFDISPDVEI